ncbi:uncharacterized protein LOC115231284 [Argonauta hians]
MDEFPDTFSVTSVHIDTKTKILYMLSNGTCNSKKLDNSWAEETNQPGCIPSDAKLVREVYLGGPHEDIEAQTYTETLFEGEHHFTVTTHHCYPIQQVYYRRDKNIKDKSLGDGTILQVRNLKLSLDDPAVLDLPDLCKKSAAAAPMEPLDAPVSFLPGLTRHL